MTKDEPTEEIAKPASRSGNPRRSRGADDLIARMRRTRGDEDDE